jgi:LuxR family transcriptional regulator, maltose regulon positive regulatory protein
MASAYEWNRQSEASQAAQQSILLAEQIDLPALSSSGFWIQACIGLAQGQTETARQFLQQRREPPQVQMPLVEQEEVYWAAVRARLALACGQEDEAWQWESSCGKRFDDLPGPELSGELSGAGYFEYMTLARILIAHARREGNRAALSQALQLLEHLRNLAMRVGLHGWLLEIGMLTALALQAQGKIKQAVTTLGAVLAQAEPEGYVRLFADEGEPMAHLLAHICGFTTASASYIQRLQDALAHKMPVPIALAGPVAPHGLPSPLSSREQEVLALLAMGLSNQQIAERLIISINTVKCHIKHLLAKLVVTNRTQALVRARELHLL